MHSDVEGHQTRATADKVKAVDYDKVTTYSKSAEIVPPLRAPTRRDHHIAAHVIGQVGGLVVPLFNETLGQAIYVPGAIDPALAEELSRPLGERRSSGKVVTLAGDDAFTHFIDRSELQEAYRERPRTQVSTDTAELGRWQGLVAEQLDRHLRAIGKTTVFTLYSSQVGDETFGSHLDAQPVLALHMGGEKAWDVDGDSVLMRPGDGLFIPAWMRHEVNTPSGRSTHLAIAAIDDHPATSANAA
ncbi:MAG TPA: hypothetical protein VF733_05220 [Candidatus Saccharimonadales bacterium]